MGEVGSSIGEVGRSTGGVDMTVGTNGSISRPKPCIATARQILSILGTGNTTAIYTWVS